MPEGHQTAVFLSYASEENEIVRSFFEGLSQFNPLLNIDIFFDREVIHAGERLTDKIKDGLRRSEYLIIFLFGTMKPSHSWTGLEVGFYEALMEEDIRLNGSTKRQIIPIFLKELPALFAERKGINLDIDPGDIALPIDQFFERCNAPTGQARQLSTTFRELFNDIASLAESRINDDDTSAQARRKADENTAKRLKIVEESIVPNIMTTVYHSLRKRITERRIEQYFMEFEFPYDVKDGEIIRDEARLLPYGEALEVFGLPGVTGAVSWKRFKDLVQQRTPSTALEILAAVERCVISAISPNEKLDNEQIFRSPKDGRINRMIITRQYTYYDGRVTLHMYIIDLLDLGFAIDENTETILTYISISLKFRSLFLKWGATYSVQEFETISRDRTETVHFIRKFMQQLAIIEEESRIFSLDELQKIKIYSGKLSGKILGENMRLWEERCQALRDASAAMLNLNVEAEFSERAEQWRQAQESFVELTEVLNREFGLRAIKQLSKSFRPMRDGNGD
ncbi:toll/interleukin-1 receptor domain-containing protein [Rhizobium sophorae]|uniref:Toll/interleukin-1 receptor domain-containing protein n=1 Tax=Rhizobium sophorae TaxID=1535242 RepID=A0A7Y3WHA5_9HYPH|nr:toll/interleukin-1 receptor domain-containing protein [Rhizobium sophorae]NNU40570.1 toll/interleukin-1 receptor domain-containing protein [Rhizobium sophorae]